MARLFKADIGNKINFYRYLFCSCSTIGFVHRDIRRPSDMPGFSFDKIFLTEKGIRLIDVGISALKSQVGDKQFEKFVAQEINELKLFEDFFINR